MMTVGQLRRYVNELSASGLNVVHLAVELQHKMAFPFVTLVMTLLAIPFGVSTGRRGALYAVGLGHRPGAVVLDRDQPVRRARQGRAPAQPMARRLVAQHHRPWRLRLPVPDREDLKGSDRPGQTCRRGQTARLEPGPTPQRRSSRR